MKRRELTIDAYLSGADSRKIEVECVLPDKGRREREWYLPVAFLERGEVAPYLRVTDHDDTLIPIPTKQQNMALTKQAIDELIEAGHIEVASPDNRGLIGEVIKRRTKYARICRLLFEEREPGASAELKWLLQLLEDHFLLWVPVRGTPLSQHHICILRHQIRGSDHIVRRKRVRVVEQVKTAVGVVPVAGKSASGRRVVSLRTVFERLLHAFALRPIEAGIREFEASRFTSSHLCFDAPGGFLVRHVRVADLSPGPAGPAPPPREFSGRDGRVAIQGHDRDLAHIHLARTENPHNLYTRITLTLRSGTTTLWMLATVLTAALLWVVHHHARYGLPAPHVPAPDTHFAMSLPSAFSAALPVRTKHAAIAGENRQIVAAALLVGPAFASAWSLRAEGGDLLRSSLAGARVLLLVSAALSVAAALALANVLPTESGRYRAVEIYATAGYFVAVPMVIAWLLSSRPVWVCFRSMLHTELRNLLAIAPLGALIGLGGLMPSPGRVDGTLLLLCGLALAAISANPLGEPVVSRQTLYRPLAGLGALPPIVLAGAFLGFYADLLPTRVASDVCTLAGAAVALIALGAVFVRSSRNRGAVAGDAK